MRQPFLVSILAALAATSSLAGVAGPAGAPGPALAQAPSGAPDSPRTMAFSWTL